MARPPKWNGKTTAIRVPEHCAPQLLALAQQLDKPFVQNDPPPKQYLVSIENQNRSERFLISEPPDLTPEELATVAELEERFWQSLQHLTEDERMVVFCELARAIAPPISTPQ